ncbi:hypothetical protein MRX96_054960 [Rhipicephalus microplus]
MSTPMHHPSADASSHAHNHGDGSSHGSLDMHMAMYFHTGFTETILFKDWAVSSVAGMVGSVVGVFFMAALYEALKYFREHLFRLHFSSMSYSSVSVTGRDGRTLNGGPSNSQEQDSELATLATDFPTYGSDATVVDVTDHCH